MLSDEEREAIENMKSLLLYSKEHEYFSPFQEQEIDDMNIVLNIVEKQSKEIEELKEVKWYYEISRVPKDKIKAKIESVDYGYHSKAERIAMKEVLQSLLEKK